MGLLKRLNPFCWRKIGWGGRRRVWLDAPKLYAVVFVEKQPRMWARPFRLYFLRWHSPDQQPVLQIQFGWIKRMVTLEFIKGGVHDKDIANLKEKIDNLTYFKDVRRKRMPWWKSPATCTLVAAK